MVWVTTEKPINSRKQSGGRSRAKKSSEKGSGNRPEVRGGNRVSSRRDVPLEGGEGEKKAGKASMGGLRTQGLERVLRKEKLRFGNCGGRNNGETPEKKMRNVREI